jgi:hypothetical protein
MRDQQHDAQCNRGEAVCAAQPQQRAQDSAHENTGAVDDPVGAEESGDNGSDNRAQSRSHEALPRQNQGIDSGEQNYDGGDRRPVELRQLQAAGREQRRNGGDRGPCGVNEGRAAESQMPAECGMSGLL